MSTPTDLTCCVVIKPDLTLWAVEKSNTECEKINSLRYKMNKLLVILIVLVALQSFVQNAPVGRQRGKNKNNFKKAEKVRES